MLNQTSCPFWYFLFSHRLYFKNIAILRGQIAFLVVSGGERLKKVPNIDGKSYVCSLEGLFTRRMNALQERGLLIYFTRSWMAR